MKLEIFLSGLGDKDKWGCHLPLEGATCFGFGSTPIQAYEDYLIDILETTSNGIDGVWCKERGLLK